MQMHTRSARALMSLKLSTLAAMLALGTHSAQAQSGGNTSTADEQYRLGLYQR